MSQSGLSAFDSTMQTTNAWLQELMQQMKWLDKHRAYRALRTVLHALRDRLTVEETAALGAQLPLLVRGLYYEGWRPADKLFKERKKDQFLDRVKKAFCEEPDVRPEETVRAVFQLLARHVSAGEIEKIKHTWPQDLRELWP